MQVYMLKDVERVGRAGQIITVSDGYAKNFLFPQKSAVEVNEGNRAFYEQKKLKEKVTAEMISSKAALLAERIKELKISVKEKVHDDGKLYGSVGADEIVMLLKKHEVSVERKQVEFPKAIKAIGEHKVAIKLSAKLRPEFTLIVEAEKAAH